MHGHMKVKFYAFFPTLPMMCTVPFSKPFLIFFQTNFTSLLTISKFQIDSTITEALEHRDI